jgi:hypothetical protein
LDTALLEGIQEPKCRSLPEVLGQDVRI